MAEQAKIVTGIGKAELHRILVRGYDLNKELVGKITFTDMTSLILRGRLPTPNEAKMLDALLVILVEHGMVSHVVAARLIYHCAPEAMQAAVAAALCGALVGFAPFNKPIARLFLGDVGSLPVGLLLGWMLVLLAGRGHLAAAILLPLYYLADATITLMRRTMKGERITQAHRSHFYQRALDRGYSVYQIVGRVFVLNILLAALDPRIRVGET